MKSVTASEKLVSIPMLVIMAVVDCTMTHVLVVELVDLVMDHEYERGPLDRSNHQSRSRYSIRFGSVIG